MASVSFNLDSRAVVPDKIGEIAVAKLQEAHRRGLSECEIRIEDMRLSVLKLFAKAPLRFTDMKDGSGNYIFQNQKEFRKPLKLRNLPTGFFFTMPNQMAGSIRYGKAALLVEYGSRSLKVPPSFFFRTILDEVLAQSSALPRVYQKAVYAALTE